MAVSETPQSLATIKIPEFTDADPEALTSADDPIDGYEFDADHYDPDAVHGFYLHRARREALGLNWLEYLNAATPDIPEPSAAAIERAVSDAVGGDVDDASVTQIVERVKDDLSADVREAAYHGAQEAIQDAR